MRPESLEAILEPQRPDRRRRARRRGDARRSPTGSPSLASDEPRACAGAAAAAACTTGSRCSGSGSPGAQTWERDGVIASIVPSCPQRSICNSVAYADGGAARGGARRARRSSTTAGRHRRHGPSGRRSSTARRSRCSSGAATNSTASPTAMSIAARRLRAARSRRPRLGPRPRARRPRPPQRSRLRAARARPGSPPRSPRSPELPELRLYRARVDGEPACVLATLDHGDDLGFYFVATHPDRAHWAGLAADVRDRSWRDAAAASRPRRCRARRWAAPSTRGWATPRTSR